MTKNRWIVHFLLKAWKLAQTFFGPFQLILDMDPPWQSCISKMAAMNSRWPPRQLNTSIEYEVLIIKTHVIHQFISIFNEEHNSDATLAYSASFWQIKMNPSVLHEQIPNLITGKWWQIAFFLVTFHSCWILFHLHLKAHKCLLLHGNEDGLHIYIMKFSLYTW